MELKILDFFASWCGPCKTMASILEEVEKETGIKVQKINVDEEDEHTEQYGIRNIPTLIFIKNDEVIDKIVGVVKKEILINKINEYSK